MDIDFVIHDTYATIRPQWKVLMSLDEAGSAFATAVSQNYKTSETEKAPDPEEPEDDGSSDGGEEESTRVPEADEGPSSSEEVDVEVAKVSLFYYTTLISKRIPTMTMPK